MSSFYKRRIAQKLSRCIASCKTTSVKQLEDKIFKIIQVQPPKKKIPCPSQPQFAISLSKLNSHVKEQSNSWNGVEDAEGLSFSEDREWLRVKVDHEQFNKHVLEDIRSHGSEFGYLENRCEQPENICFEYSSPNIAKPFHVGHLRSTIIGNVLSNMYEAVGHNVYRVNFLGDWGTQFGLLSLGLMRHADLEKLKKDPLQELFNIYVKINQDVKSECGKESEMTSQTYQESMTLFSRLEQGDKGMEAIWKMVNDMSVKELDKIYERLGVHFTHVMAESSYHQKSTDIIQHLKETGLLQYGNDGVGYVPMAEEKTHGRASVVKSDGSSLYLTRDVASGLERQDLLSLDRMHYVVDQGQRTHFVKLAHILKELNVPWASRQIDELHIRFGRVTGMSTRQGNVVFLGDVLDEAKCRVIESMKDRHTTKVTDSDLEEVGDVLGVTCIILQDLKSNRVNDYAFLWDRALNMKADSGMFVQYCHARIFSMISNCGISLTDGIDISAINDDSLQVLILHMARYADIVSEALNRLEPHHIVQYLFRLCHLINNAYKNCPVKGESADVAQARLLVFDCSRQVMVNCMHILGLRPLERI